jgi:nicotinamide-nucleotide amidase
MNAEIIAIGSELLTPYRLDTNSLYLTDELNKLGIRVIHKAVVGDSRNEMRSSFRHALDRADLIIASGGLGPTDDDLTRETVADLLGRKLSLNEEILRGIQERFRRFARTMPEINARQAMVPQGAVVLPNPRGTAPGLWIEPEGHIVILLPGPPAELKGLFESEVRARLARHGSSERLYTRDLRITGLPESEVEQRVRPLYEMYPDTETTILASPTGIQLHPRVWSRDAAQAEKLLEEIVSRMALALGEHLYSTKGESLEEVVARELLENRATIAVAESCTGGMLAERLTNIPGSSTYFLGGVVCYSNDLKTSLVNVPPGLDRIERRGQLRSRPRSRRRHSQIHRSNPGHRRHRNRGPRRRHARKTRGPRAHRHLRRARPSRTRLPLPRRSRAHPHAGHPDRARYRPSSFPLPRPRTRLSHCAFSSRLIFPTPCAALSAN